MLLADTIAHGKQGIAMTPHGFLTAETGNVGVILLSLRTHQHFHYREMVRHVLYQELGCTEFQGIFFIVAKHLFQLHAVLSGMGQSCLEMTVLLTTCKQTKRANNIKNKSQHNFSSIDIQQTNFSTENTFYLLHENNVLHVLVFL